MKLIGVVSMMTLFMRMPSSCMEKKIISTLTLLEDEMVMEVCLVLKAFFFKRSSL